MTPRECLRWHLKRLALHVVGIGALVLLAAAVGCLGGCGGGGDDDAPPACQPPTVKPLPGPVERCPAANDAHSATQAVLCDLRPELCQ